MEPFDGLPKILVHAVTVNLALVDTNTGDLREVQERYRRRLRHMLDGLNEGGIVRGKFDMVLKYADDLGFDLTDADVPEELHGIPRPHRRYGMLHIHFAVFDPRMSREEVRNLLVSAFPGRKRVRVETPYDDVVHPDGTVTHGLQGFLEYLSMEKTEIDFGDESTEAILEFAKLDDTWSRANRNFSLGKRTEDTSSLINQERVEELIHMDKMNDLRKRFSQMTFAERFLHIWMSNARSVLEEVKLSRLVGVTDFSLSALLGVAVFITCNSCRRFFDQVSENLLPFLGVMSESCRGPPVFCCSA